MWDYFFEWGETTTISPKFNFDAFAAVNLLAFGLKSEEAGLSNLFWGVSSICTSIF